MHRIVIGFLLTLFSCFAFAQEGETEDIFERYNDRIVQIRVLETASGSRTGIGSGFYVNDTGYVITNYHVIAEVIHRPDRYKVEVVHQDGQTAPLTLLNFDAIHDLAIGQTTLVQPDFFEMRVTPLRKGVRVFSIGTPHDLGFTIVEGTYNGLISQSLYEKIHFTGSINPGMSGGPAITSDGQVIGVNVATSGNQVSFMVPAKFVQKLLDETRTKKMTALQLAKHSALDKLRDQLLANQNTYMSKLLAKPLITTTIGKYKVPAKFAPFLRCWGDSNRKDENLYETLSQECSSEDDLYVSRSHASGILSFKHTLITSGKLNKFRFFRLYQRYFESEYNGIKASKEDVAKFVCNSDFVESNSITFKGVLCLRAYKKLPGLYDAVLRIATLNESNQGIQSTLVMGGVSFDNATRFSQKYLESFTWAK